MPKYYTPSTGQVSEEPPQSMGLSQSTGMANAGTAGQMSGASQMTPLGIDYPTMQKVFTLYALKNPKAAATLNTILGWSKPPTKSGAQITAENEQKGNAQSIMQGLKDLQTTRSKMTELERLAADSPAQNVVGRFSPNVASFVRTRDLISRTIGKMIEKARLSDQDALFYASNMPQAFSSDKSFSNTIGALDKYLGRRLTESSSVNNDLTPPETSTNSYSSGQSYNPMEAQQDEVQIP